MSNLINCTCCNNQLSKKAVTCPKCGHPLKIKDDNNLLLIIGFILIIIGMFSTPFIFIGLGMILIYPIAKFHSYLINKNKNL